MTDEIPYTIININWSTNKLNKYYIVRTIVYFKLYFSRFYTFFLKELFLYLRVEFSWYSYFLVDMIQIFTNFYFIVKLKV